LTFVTSVVVPEGVRRPEPANQVVAAASPDAEETVLLGFGQEALAAPLGEGGGSEWSGHGRSPWRGSVG
jgi:hypothetical protein